MFLEELINNYREEYIANVAEIPVFKIRKFYSTKSFAKFEVDDLYKEEYVLYVNDELGKYPQEMIKQIIFHEFTHLEDSKRFINYSYDKFKVLMNIYSEVHASERLMNELLKTQSKQPYSLSQQVTYNIKLPLSEFMRQTVTKLDNNFVFNRENLFKFTFNYKSFYYLVGYLISLKKNNIDYAIHFRNMDEQLAKLFIEIINVFLEDDYNNNEELLIKYEQRIIEMIEYKTKEMLGLLNVERLKKKK